MSKVPGDLIVKLFQVDLRAHELDRSAGVAGAAILMVRFAHWQIHLPGASGCEGHACTQVQNVGQICAFLWLTRAAHLQTMGDVSKFFG